MFIFNVIYGVVREFYTFDIYVPGNYPDNYSYGFSSFCMIYLAICIVLSASFKGMSLARYDENFGSFVDLFIRSFKAMIMFLVFFISWMILFAIVYII